MRITLWVEGYHATGNRAKAMFCGEYSAVDLRDAVRQYRDTLTDEYSKQCINLDSDPPNYWLCQFFDNEEDARKGYG